MTWIYPGREENDAKTNLGQGEKKGFKLTEWGQSAKGIDGDCLNTQPNILKATKFKIRIIFFTTRKYSKCKILLFRNLNIQGSEYVRQSIIPGYL